MSKRKRRGTPFGDRSRKIREFVISYQHSLKALIASLPEHYRVVATLDIVAVGLAEIWPCSDGTAILIHRDPLSEIEVVVRERVRRTVDEFFATHEAVALYDEGGNPAPVSFGVLVRGAPQAHLDFAGFCVETHGVQYRPRYQHGIVFGKGAPLPAPDEQALIDFRSVFVTRNIGGSESLKLSLQKAQEITRENASRLIEEFRALLNNARREEDVQRFLNEHPQLLYPDFIDCFPKFALGDDFETDYIFLVQGPDGPEYVFVEIERPSKTVFTKQGQFSAYFTQAKNQILDWDRWSTQNADYISKKLPGLYKPKFHLVMGRSDDLTSEQREKLKTEFTSTSRVFSTYDDLAERFQQIVDRVV